MAPRALPHGACHTSRSRRLNEYRERHEGAHGCRDGFPQDLDYGPVRGNHDYGVEDTPKPCRNASKRVSETFCMTVDKSGHDYLKRMCPDERYMIIEEMEDLPSQLTKVRA